MLYVVIQRLAKLSILISYLRIFPSTIRWFRVSVCATMVWACTHGLIITLLTAFQCIPVRSLWDKSIHGKCLDLRGIIIAGTAFSIVDDLLIMALPIPCISSLHLGKMKKFGVGLMFALGSL